MRHTIAHTAIGTDKPHWYHLDTGPDYQQACHRALNYALDHGGYVCVRDSAGTIVYGTDPDELDRTITQGMNQHFTAPSA